MERQLADKFIQFGVRTAKDLDELLAEAKTLCSAKEFLEIRGGAGKVLGYLLTDIMNPILSEHKDLTPPQLTELP